MILKKLVQKTLGERRQHGLRHRRRRQRFPQSQHARRCSHFPALFLSLHPFQECLSAPRKFAPLCPKPSCTSQNRNSPSAGRIFCQSFSPSCRFRRSSCARRFRVTFFPGQSKQRSQRDSFVLSPHGFQTVKFYIFD